jgi:ubiquinone/menaquinone biosynthesis C-methylase UbiE
MLEIVSQLLSIIKKVLEIRDRKSLPKEANVEIASFRRREETDSLMMQSLKDAEEVDFIGTSHRNLYDFLRPILHNKNKLRTINVLYSSNADGLARDSNFQITMQKSIRNIANLIGHEVCHNNLSEDFALNLFQMRHNCYFNGCRIDGREFYISNRLYGEGIESEFEYTVYFEKPKKSDDSRTIFECYTEAFDALRHNAVYLGKLKKDLWNLSVNQWDNFINHSYAYRANMQEIVKIVKDINPSCVMEVCCGTGQLTRMLADSLKDCQLVFVDKSSKMISRCEEKLRSSALGYVFDVTDPSANTEYFFGDQPSVDLIICHISIPIPEIGIENFVNFLNFCFDCLNMGGYLVISLLNTTIKMENDKFDPKKDVFRESLKTFSKNAGFGKHYRPKSKDLISQSDFKRVIIKTGRFEIVSQLSKVYPFTMQERLNMWKTPAVIDTVLDYEEIEKKELNSVFKQLENAVSGKSTPDMSVVNYVIRKRITMVSSR